MNATQEGLNGLEYTMKWYFRALLFFSIAFPICFALLIWKLEGLK